MKAASAIFAFALGIATQLHGASADIFSHYPIRVPGEVVTAISRSYELWAKSHNVHSLAEAYSTGVTIRASALTKDTLVDIIEPSGDMAEYATYEPQYPGFPHSGPDARRFEARWKLTTRQAIALLAAYRFSVAHVEDDRQDRVLHANGYDGEIFPVSDTLGVRFWFDASAQIANCNPVRPFKVYAPDDVRPVGILC